MRGQFGSRLGSNIQNQVIIRHVGRRLDGCHGISAEGFGSHHVSRNRHLSTTRLHRINHGFGVIHQTRLSQTFANTQTGGQHEGVGNAAAHNQLVHILGKGLQDGEFARHLAAGHDSHQRALRASQSFADGVNLGRQERASAGNRRVLGDAVGGAFGAVRGAKCVVDKNIAQRGQFAPQSLVVLLFADVDTAVFEHHDLAGSNRHPVDPVGHQWHLTAQQLAQAFGHRGQRVSWLERPFCGAPQMAGNHDRRTGVQRHLDAGHGGPDAGVLGNLAGRILRHIQVSANENTLLIGKATCNDIGETQYFHSQSP